MARILFTTFGSYGDLFPYLSVGSEVRARGHDVTIATSASFEGKVRAAGLDFHAVRPDMSLSDAKLLEYIFDAKRGTERVLRLITSVVHESYEDTLPAARKHDLIVTHPITFAAVIVARKLRMPWVSSVLAPISFMSSYDPPILAPAPWFTQLWPFGRKALSFVFSLGRRSALPWVRPVMDLARSEGIAPYGNPVFEGSHSPQCVLALFSRLLGEPQPDWPANVVQTGFPFYDQADTPLDPALDAFLDDGEPVVFTLGSSAVSTAGEFYRESLEAVQRLGARALFLTGAQKQGLPDTMPPGTLAWPYASHANVFPRAAAIVHQGGVGTTAQAMRSGRPMLVVPFSHDQFDNAERVRRLGAAEVVFRSQYSVRAAALLKRLLAEPNYRSAAQQVGQSIRGENGASRAADAVERVLTAS